MAHKKPQHLRHLNTRKKNKDEWNLQAGVKPVIGLATVAVGINAIKEVLK